MSSELDFISAFSIMLLALMVVVSTISLQLSHTNSILTKAREEYLAIRIIEELCSYMSFSSSINVGLVHRVHLYRISMSKLLELKLMGYKRLLKMLDVPENYRVKIVIEELFNPSNRLIELGDVDENNAASTFRLVSMNGEPYIVRVYVEEADGRL